MKLQTIFRASQTVARGGCASPASDRSAGDTSSRRAGAPRPRPGDTAVPSLARAGTDFTVVDYAERIPPGYVITGRLHSGGMAYAVGRLPDPQTGLLWVAAGLTVPGWRVVERSPMRGEDALAPRATWRAWRLYYSVRRLLSRAAYPVAWRVLAALARLSRVEIPTGATVRGALEMMGAAVEADRRARGAECSR